MTQQLLENYVEKHDIFYNIILNDLFLLQKEPLKYT